MAGRPIIEDEILLILLGDVFGYIGLAFLLLTATLMLGRKRLLRYTRNLTLIRKLHIYFASGAGLFIILHMAFFLSYPVTYAVLLGYLSAAVAGIVWITGTAFLERLRDSLFYHGAMSFTTIALIVVHSTGAGVNIPIGAAGVTLAIVTFLVMMKAWHHLSKLLTPSRVGRT